MQYETLLITEAKKYLTPFDVTLLQKACTWIQDAPEQEHTLRCGIEIAKLHMDVSSIIAALIHIKVEDPSITREDIINFFGEDVAHITDGLLTLVQITKQSLTATLPQDVEHLQRFLIISAKDIRVLLIKLACRLDHLRHVENKKDPFDYAKNSENVFLPLTEYIGIDIFKREMEDIIFRTLQASLYEKIAQAVQEVMQHRDQYVKDTIEEIQMALSLEHIQGNVFGRPKTLYSTYKKIIHKQGDLDLSRIKDLNDLIALSILVDNVSECYKTLGIIHHLWPYEKEEFDDYISKPKGNGFRAIQTTIRDIHERRIEIQIKTHDMHEYNEYGPASHIAYKKYGTYTPKPSNDYGWVKNLSSWKNGKKREDSYALNLFENRIFVLTPKGSVKELPVGATPIDFAYKIHVDIGHSCKGAKINGILAPLDTKLHNGDIVEILTSKNKGLPKKGWLDFTLSPSAKHHIRKALGMEHK